MEYLNCTLAEFWMRVVILELDSDNFGQVQGKNFNVICLLKGYLDSYNFALEAIHEGNGVFRIRRWISTMEAKEALPWNKNKQLFQNLINDIHG